MSIDAMKQALEALEEIHHGNMTPMAEEAWNKAIAALRLAIEQAEKQEPVAWEPKIETQYQDGFVVSQRVKRTPDGPWEDCTAPTQRQPLTEQEALKIFEQARNGSVKPVGVLRGIRAIERAHGIGGGV